MNKIVIGQWRDDADGPIQVVSGPVGRRKVHFQAPPADALPVETAKFLSWANEETGEPALIKAGLAHLWFVTLHPYDDGNGRIARAVGDLFLARADGSPQRFYSLSAQIQRERKDYYDVLVKARFWQRWTGTPLNERQVKLLNRLLNGFEGKLTSSKWATIANALGAP